MKDAVQSSLGVKPTLNADRLVLRAVLDEDVSRLVELDSDPEVRKHVDLPVAPTADQVRGVMLPRWRGFDQETPGVGYWIAEVGGEFVGWFHLRPPKHVAERVALAGDQELGYRLKRAAWGKGLATEGSEVLLGYAFETLGAPRVTGSCLEANVASSRVMEKVGMTLLCRLDYKPGQPAVVYAIERASHGARAGRERGAQ